MKRLLILALCALLLLSGCTLAQPEGGGLAEGVRAMRTAWQDTMREEFGSETAGLIAFPERDKLVGMDEAALRQAKANGYEQVELGVFEDNPRARHLYEKLGFQEQGRTLRAFRLKDGTYRDEIQMVKFL